MSGRQAKVLNSSQQKIVIGFLETTRYPIRNKLIFNLSFKAGLRSKEIADLTWSSVCDPEGNIIRDITISDSQSKGKSGRTIPMSETIYDGLKAIREGMDTSPTCFMDRKVITSERGIGMSSHSIVNIFRDWYTKLGLHGCSSHSGRRTFITQASRKIGLLGGSIRTVQVLAGHSNLGTTQRYIEYDTHCIRKLVEMV